MQSAYELNTNASIVAAAFKNTKTSKTFIPLLTDNAPLVLISKASIGNDVQVTSFHTLYGSSLLSQKKSLLCLSGLTSGAPIEL